MKAGLLPSEPQVTFVEQRLPKEWRKFVDQFPGSERNQATASWYLDPAVAVQKREVHRRLIYAWARDLEIKRYLKTDLFEEANGPDQLLFGLFPDEARAVALDISLETVRRAWRRGGRNFLALAADARHVPLRPVSMDLIISTSTLDHLAHESELTSALKELAALLRPGGRLVITMDNLENPLYRPMRWAFRLGWLPVQIGHTTNMEGLCRALASAGLEVTGRSWLLHNPRLLTTVLCLGLRKALGRRADGPIRLMLNTFTLLDRVPVRRWSACFIAACAVRRPQPERLPDP